MSASTMFGPAKHKYLRDMISLRNPQAAMGSIRELSNEFRSAKTHVKRLRIARATQLASNRASASAKKRNLSVAEKGQYRGIANLYAGAAKAFFRGL